MRHDALDWFPIDRLPDDTVAYGATGIQHYRRRQPFSLHNWCEA